ncbi:beta-lactamase [Colletotrichum truncatum]|uniref:Beta-lactamase n=1 Tax=Colletotrichum truncatum TaxID=5467 RepID=A0ACC3YRL6_COLTU|nr:beta-lactamase [Colletotrichum truncatum]KAF6799284.1 beta-lactamase [Colletotrichum truncatum]
MNSLDAILAKHTAAVGQEDTTDKLLGATFFVVNKDGILYSGSAGRRDHALDSPPWDAGTFTFVASMTKIITATSIMQLVERGLVGLDDDIRDLAPQLKQMPILRGFTSEEEPILEDHDTPISLRTLLTHSAGLSYDAMDPSLQRWLKATSRKPSPQWSLESFITPFVFKPGESWCYGTAIDWVGFVLEKITGKTLGEYMTEDIFEPLGMKDTGFWPEKLPHISGRISGWAYRDGDKSTLGPGPQPFPTEHEVESGGAGLHTTAQDYAKFLHALLTNKIVSKETVDEMFRPQFNDELAKVQTEISLQLNATPQFEPNMKLNHGLTGFINMGDAPGKRKKGSMTWSGMCNSHWWMDRESGIAAALFVQILPFGDPIVIRLYDELERAVYSELLPHGKKC